MNELFLALINLTNAVVQLLIILVIVNVVISWLVAFNIINPYNQAARQIIQVLNALTEPLLRPIRNLLPPLSGVDLSPLVFILVASFLVQGWLLPTLARTVAS